MTAQNLSICNSHCLSAVETLENFADILHQLIFITCSEDAVFTGKDE